LSIFWSNGLVGTIVALALALLLWPVWAGLKDWMRRRERVADGRARA